MKIKITAVLRGEDWLKGKYWIQNLRTATTIFFYLFFEKFLVPQIDDLFRMITSYHFDGCRVLPMLSCSDRRRQLKLVTWAGNRTSALWFIHPSLHLFRNGSQNLNENCTSHYKFARKTKLWHSENHLIKTLASHDLLHNKFSVTLRFLHTNYS